MRAVPSGAALYLKKNWTVDARNAEGPGRVVRTQYEDSILSNLEPIDGKDDPDLDWW